MSVTAQPGPIVVFGQNQPPASGQPSPDYNPDLGPSMVFGGMGLVDPRYGYRGPSGNGSNVAIGFAPGSRSLLVDQVPSAIAVDNIAVAQATVAATPMTLVSSTAAGITVMTSALQVQATGNIVPAGSLCIDALPLVTSFGTAPQGVGPVGFYDPTTAIARAVSISGNAASSAQNVTVRGYDIYGVPMTETIAFAGGAVTTNGKKAFKFIASVTPAATDAGHLVSVGTTDIFGFGLRVERVPFADVSYNSGKITSTTGFVTSVATSPATATTGDVRGTYAVQSATDGTKRLQMWVSLPLASLVSGGAVNLTGMFGVTQYTG